MILPRQQVFPGCTYDYKDIVIWMFNYIPNHRYKIYPLKVASMYAYRNVVIPYYTLLVT